MKAFYNLLTDFVIIYFEMVWLHTSSVNTPEIKLFTLSFFFFRISRADRSHTCVHPHQSMCQSQSSLIHSYMVGAIPPSVPYLFNEMFVLKSVKYVSLHKS